MNSDTRNRSFKVDELLSSDEALDDFCRESVAHLHDICNDPRIVPDKQFKDFSFIKKYIQDYRSINIDELSKCILEMVKAKNRSQVDNEGSNVEYIFPLGEKAPAVSRKPSIPERFAQVLFRKWFIAIAATLAIAALVTFAIVNEFNFFKGDRQNDIIGKSIAEIEVDSCPPISAGKYIPATIETATTESVNVSSDRISGAVTGQNNPSFQKTRRQIVPAPQVQGIDSIEEGKPKLAMLDLPPVLQKNARIKIIIEEADAIKSIREAELSPIIAPPRKPGVAEITPLPESVAAPIRQWTACYDIVDNSSEKQEICFAASKKLATAEELLKEGKDKEAMKIFRELMRSDAGDDLNRIAQDGVLISLYLQQGASKEFIETANRYIGKKDEPL